MLGSIYIYEGLHPGIYLHRCTEPYVPVPIRRNNNNTMAFVACKGCERGVLPSLAPGRQRCMEISEHDLSGQSNVANHGIHYRYQWKKKIFPRYEIPSTHTHYLYHVVARILFNYTLKLSCSSFKSICLIFLEKQLTFAPSE